MRDDLQDLLHALRLPEAARRPPEKSLTGAAVSGDVATAAAFLEAGADIEERSIGFASPLQAAAGAGRREMVEFLLARGASVDPKPGAVYSPLSAAAGHGHLDIVRLLLDAAPDIGRQEGAVREAAAAGATDVLDLLLERGAPLGPHAGHTLRVAALRGRFACVKRLLAAGVDPRNHPDYARDMFGDEVETPYLPRQAALDNGHVAVALLLDGREVSDATGRAAEARLPPPGAGLRAALDALAGGPRPRPAAPAEPPPLEGPARQEAVARLLALLRGKTVAGLDQPGPRGRPLLVMAAEAGLAPVVDTLLDAGASPDAAGADGETALLAACRFGHADVVAGLLARGADVDRRDGSGLTPLMVAAARGSLDAVQALLARGADARVRVRGKSAVGFAFGVHKAAIRAAVEKALEGRP